jgi:hypothetical protein
VSPEQLKEATLRFLDKYPKALARIEADVISEMKRNKGASDDDIRTALIDREVFRHAQMYNLEPYRFLVRLGVDDPLERQRLFDEYDTEVAKELGLSLSEYRQPPKEKTESDALSRRTKDTVDE